MFDRISYQSLDCLRPFLLLAGLILAIGCGADEQIRTYTVAKESQPASDAPATALSAQAESSEAPDRMLVAILPAGDKGTFFKVVGPAATVEEYKDDFTDFVATLKVADGNRPNWTTPRGWKEEPGSGMRTATLWIPTAAKPLAMSVTQLPWGGAQDELLSNVNRWRGQMQLPPIGPQQLGDVTSEIKAGDATVTVVDLTGRFGGAGMMAPFAGGASGSANRAPPGASSEVPPGHPPVDSVRTAPGSAPAATDVPKFDAPKSWRPVPASGMRKAVFTIGSEEQGGIVTLIDFTTNAGLMIADPLSNVNRWRREVGLAEIEKDQLSDAMESIEIGGHPANYVRLIPDAAKPEESKTDRATLAAMATVGEQIWFIKLIGHRNLVIAEEENFKAFLKSMRFAADRGAPNGDK
jgi:hypothetical protein